MSDGGDLSRLVFTRDLLDGSEDGREGFAVRSSKALVDLNARTDTREVRRVEVGEGVININL